MRSIRLFSVFLVAALGWPAVTSAQQPAPLPICEICTACDPDPTAVRPCVRQCTPDRELSLSGVPFSTAPTAPAGAVSLDIDTTLPQLMRIATDSGVQPRCDCAAGTDEVYFASGEDITGGLTTVAMDASGTPRVRAQMCTSKPVRVARPLARCNGAQAPFVVSLSDPAATIGVSPTFAWGESDIRETCREPINNPPCPDDYTHDGAGTCTATSVDTSALVSGSTSHPYELRVDNEYIDRFVTSYAWRFPSPANVPALTCPDGTAVDGTGRCAFVHAPVSRYITRAALQAARGTALETEAPEFFGPNAIYTLALPDPVPSRVGRPPCGSTPQPPCSSGPLTLDRAFPRVALTPAFRSLPRVTLPPGVLGTTPNFAYVAFGDDIIEEARGGGTRPGGRAHDQLGTNAVHLLRDVRPPQFFESDAYVCTPDTTYDDADDRCEGTAFPIRQNHPPPIASSVRTCGAGLDSLWISATRAGGSSVEVGVECWRRVRKPDSDPLDTDDEIDTRTGWTSYSYYRNNTTRSIRTYNDPELQVLENPIPINDPYPTQACRHGYPVVIEDAANAGTNITVCFTNGRFPPEPTAATDPATDMSDAYSAAVPLDLAFEQKIVPVTPVATERFRAAAPCQCRVARPYSRFTSLK